MVSHAGAMLISVQTKPYKLQKKIVTSVYLLMHKLDFSEKTVLKQVGLSRMCKKLPQEMVSHQYVFVHAQVNFISLQKNTHKFDKEMASCQCVFTYAQANYVFFLK